MEGLLPVDIGTRTIEDLVGVTMAAKGVIVVVRMAVVVGVRVRHFVVVVVVEVV